MWRRGLAPMKVGLSDALGTGVLPMTEGRALMQTSV